MSETGDGLTDSTGGAMDTAAHREGYERFLGWFKWGTVVAAVVAALAVYLIAR